MKEEIKKYNKIINELQKIKEQKEEKEKNYITAYEILERCKEENKTSEEIKEEIKKQEEKNNIIKKELEDINKKYDILGIEKNIIYNNMIYNFINKYNNNILEILKKYEDKRIGEKTEEKIQEEIKNIFIEFKEKYNIYVYFRSFEKDIYNKIATLNIEIIKNDLVYHFSNKLIDIKYNFKIYNNCYEEIYNKKCYEIESKERLFYSSLEEEKENNNNYKTVNNPKKEAINIYNNYNKSIKKYNEYIEKMKDIRKSYYNTFYNYKLKEELQEKYKIPYEIRIY